MKTSDIRKKSQAELHKLIADHEAELRTFRFGMSGSHTKNVKHAREVKKDIARIKTVLNEIK